MMEQDTRPEARRRYVELLRSKSEVERLEAAASLTSAAREMTRLGIRARHPNASDVELRERFMEVVYGVRSRSRESGG
ncbi:hypothetical protein [Vulgatibacter incomptus]|uniref:Uncharacterized protein n=1 Tax=Vulgatibacter incomptus TaxID=1391653 RepID=A0A0K1PBS8_9BACT|nr:hypothetical protein [Vulgatibacter incomptus]AKU90980.1 hypothetical protein AKJ08_1367 [Vulgatibacter incomptus]